MDELNLLQRIAVWLLPVLFAITVHETAHGWMAKQLGDRTAERLGRLTLNPIRHIDPLGTVVVPGLLLTFGGFLFGWAKPVPVTWSNLKRPRRDMALVAAAGPGANLLMALIWAGVVRLGTLLSGDAALFVVLVGAAGIYINTILMVLYLLPLPPLDGGRVIGGVLPPRAGLLLDRIEPYGIFILLGLILTGVLGQILWPVVALLLDWIGAGAGLPPQLFHLLLAHLMG